MGEELGSVYRSYGFEHQKGTLRHLAALAQLGPWAAHRHSFMSLIAAKHQQLDFFLVEIRKAKVKHKVSAEIKGRSYAGQSDTLIAAVAHHRSD